MGAIADEIAAAVDLVDAQLVDPRQRGVQVTIERVAYDAEAVAREVAAAGLPAEYADKLLAAA